MAADQKRVASDLECIGDRIIDACLDAMRGMAGMTLPACVARIELQDLGFQSDLGLNALASRRADVLTKANRPCLRQDRFTQAQGYLGVGGGMGSLRPSR